MINRITKIEEYNDLLSQYKNKESWSNNYMLSDEVSQHIVEGKLFCLTTIQNLYILLKQTVCYRLYYCINDASDKTDIFTDDKIAIEILFRGDNFYPTEEIEYWKNVGFKENLVRDLYSTNFKDVIITDFKQDDVIIRFAQNESEVEFAIDLFNSVFDIYTSDFLSKAESLHLLVSQTMLVAERKGTLLGAFHFDKVSNCYWGRHLAVSSNARGLHLGQRLFQEMIRIALKENPKARFFHWTQRKNEYANRIYRSLGYKYSNKSTISLIK